MPHVQVLTRALLQSMLCYCQHAEEFVEMLVRCTGSAQSSGLCVSGFDSS